MVSTQRITDFVGTGTVGRVWSPLTLYNPQYTSDFYDDYGEEEWNRLVKTAANRVNFHIHQWILQRFIRPGMNVLEAGAGPGRFTIELAKLDAMITVGDISEKQLELNDLKVAEAGFENHIVDRRLCNIVDLSAYASHQFDAVVCYGGPLSYTFDQFDRAFSELLRVTKPDGHVLFSVMSCIGTVRAFFPAIITHYHAELIQDVLETGDLYGEVANNKHVCHMFRWSELQALIEQHDCAIVHASAANYLSPGHEAVLDDVMEVNPTLWHHIIGWEVMVGQEPGAIDGGTHIVVVVRKTG